MAAETEAKTIKSGIIKDRAARTDIRIATIPEKMMYDVTELTIKAGKKIRLTFANPDFMPHNILLVNPCTEESVAMKAVALGSQGFEMGFVPESPDIIWASKLLENGQEEVINFTAPAEPGDYPFICSFPGHYIMMRGVFHVR